MNRPTFSVVIAAYNAADTLGDAIRSVRSQTVADFELIVVDDGSTDDTGSEIERFVGDPRVRHIEQPNAGVSAARNRALEAATGRYVSFLDADDLLLPPYLEVMGETLARDPGAAFADCDFWILDDRERKVSPSPHGRLALPSRPEELMRILLRRNVLHYATTVRAEVLREVGYFNPTLRAAEDLELWLRILAHGFAAVRAPGCLCVWRSRGGSLSTQSALLTRSLCEAYGLVAEEYDVPDDIRALARSRLRTEERRLAALNGGGPIAAALARVRRTARKLRRRPGRHELPTELAELLGSDPEGGLTQRF